VRDWKVKEPEPNSPHRPAFLVQKAGKEEHDISGRDKLGINSKIAD
jgi:hypothetical protein